MDQHSKAKKKIAVNRKPARIKGLKKRITRAASIYDPSHKSGSAKSQDKRALLKSDAAKNAKSKGRIVGRKNKKSAPSIDDKAAIKRYKLLQDESSKYMNLVETQARKLLEIQQKVMQASMHLEYIRSQHGGYNIPTSVLNSGEKGSKEAVEREKAFFEKHISNLESQVVAENTMRSKEDILQAKLRANIEKIRRTIMSKKETILHISADLDKTKLSIQSMRSNIETVRNTCLKEKKKIDRVAQREKRMMGHIAKQIFTVEHQRREAIARHRMEMTSTKHQVEKKRRAANLEGLATRPAKAGRRLRPSTAANNISTQNIVARRPTTAPKRQNNNFVDPAMQSKSERTFRNQAKKVREEESSRQLASSGIFVSTTIANLGSEGDKALVLPTSPLRSPPPPIRPDFSDDPEAVEDPVRNPRKWLPGEPQKRTDPGADASPQSKTIPHPLGRRGSLIGRAPGRFPKSRLEGRLELLLSHLPKVSKKKQKTKKNQVAASWQLARKQLAQTSLDDNIGVLEATFEKIREKSGIQTIEEFATKFLESEKRQFELVKRIDSLEQHLSNIHANCHALLADREALKTKNAEKSHVGLFTKIKTEIESVNAQGEAYKSLHLKTRQHIKGCILSIGGLLSAIDSPKAREVSGVNAEQALYVEELIEGHGGVNELVIPQFLGSIEERILQLLQIYDVVMKRQDGAPAGGRSSRLSNVSRFVPDRPTSFGETAKQSRGEDHKGSEVGGRLPVKEQLKRKYANSPAWVLNLAVDMRKQVEETTNQHLYKESSKSGDTSDSTYDSSDTSDSDSSLTIEDTEESGISDVSVDSLFGEGYEDEEVQHKKKLEKKKKKEEKTREKQDKRNKILERKKMRRRKKKKKKNMQAQRALVAGKVIGKTKVSIVLPRDEELETSNSDLSDQYNSNSDEEEKPGVVVRPVSKQMMRARAAKLQNRRNEIAHFLSVGHHQRKNLVQYSEFFFCF